MISCKQKQKVDSIIKNAKIYTVNAKFDIVNAMAIKDGRIQQIGTNEEIVSSYDAEKIIDLEGKVVFPGLIDAHCHFYGYGLFESTAQLKGTKSFDEIIEILK